MKLFINLAYTRLAKSIFLLIVIVFSWLASSEISGMAFLYIREPAAFTNALIQREHFDYNDSVFLKDEMEGLISSITLYSLKYMHESRIGKQSEENYDYFMRRSNETYRQTVEFLEGLEGVSYAVVNHGTGTIISNNPQLHRAPLSVNISEYFCDYENKIILHNTENPYYENGTITDYNDFIIELSHNYTDSFDIYIGCGEQMIFSKTLSCYEQLHFDTIDSLKKNISRMYLFSTITLFFGLLLVFLSGQCEYKGKVSPAITDLIPNDLFLAIYLLLLCSVSALQNNYYYTLYKSLSVEDYFLALSPSFYVTVINVCVVCIALTLCAMLCKIKRQKKMKTLFTNTYIYRFYNILRLTKRQK